MFILCQSWNRLLCLLLISDYILVRELMALFTRSGWFIARLTFRPSWLVFSTLSSFLLNCEVQNPSEELWISLLSPLTIQSLGEREREIQYLPLWLLFTASTADGCFIKWGELTDTVGLRPIFWNAAHSEHISPRQVEKCRHGDIKKSVVLLNQKYIKSSEILPPEVMHSQLLAKIKKRSWLFLMSQRAFFSFTVTSASFHHNYINSTLTPFQLPAWMAQTLNSIIIWSMWIRALVLPADAVLVCVALVTRSSRVKQQVSLLV